MLKQIAYLGVGLVSEVELVRQVIGLGRLHLDPRPHPRHRLLRHHPLSNDQGLSPRSPWFSTGPVLPQDRA